MNKKVPLGATLALIIITIALTVSVTMVIAMRQFNSTMSDVGQRQVMFEYITDIDKTVRQHYAGTIDEEKLRAALTKGYVEGIGDPYAAYFTAAEYQKENDPDGGHAQRTGLGAGADISGADPHLPGPCGVLRRASGGTEGRCPDSSGRRSGVGGGI